MRKETTMPKNRILPGRSASRLVLALLGVACFIDVAAAQRPVVGRFAYVGGDGGEDFDIYVSDASGEGLEDLSRNDAWETAAVFSPNGRLLAFYSDRDGDKSMPWGERNFEIYVMNTDGSGVRRLTHHDGWDAHPSWSPNGRRIAFDSWRDGDGDIYVMDADGGGVRNLTNTDTDEDFPVWSPNGRLILFSGTRHRPEPDLYVMDADGGNVRRLTHTGFNVPGDWSPNGQKIVFQRDADIFVIDADGSGEHRLLRGNSPRWSFDGRHVVFDRGNRPWIMNADGSDPRQVPVSFSRNSLGPTDWARPGRSGR
jgi:TolB protein